MVVGASVAGLLAARSLSESFEEVLVRERDELPDLPMVRKGVPQSGHVHGLLARDGRRWTSCSRGSAKS